MEYGRSCSLPTSAARAKLSEIVTLVQDPRRCVVLTRHGKPVAAVVSMTELGRIWKQQDIEDLVRHGVTPSTVRFGKTEMGAATEHEAAETIQKIQLDRRMEREMLRNQGMAPIPGGEVAAEMPVAVDPPKRRRWWRRWKKG